MQKFYWHKTISLLQIFIFIGSSRIFLEYGGKKIYWETRNWSVVCLLLNRMRRIYVMKLTLNPLEILFTCCISCSLSSILCTIFMILFSKSAYHFFLYAYSIAYILWFLSLNVYRTFFIFGSIVTSYIIFYIVL